jgi:hypothetical protein
MGWWTKFKDILACFQAGKALGDAYTWSSRATAVGAIGTFASAGMALMAAFGYSIPISQENLQAIVGGVGTVVFLVVDRLHVASNKEAGVQTKPKAVVCMR